MQMTSVHDAKYTLFVNICAIPFEKRFLNLQLRNINVSVLILKICECVNP